MSRRVVFALPALPLSGSIVAYGPPGEASLKLSSAVPADRALGGTVLRVRLDRELDTARNQAGAGSPRGRDRLELPTEGGRADVEVSRNGHPR
jgi:hypothetical protein